MSFETESHEVDFTTTTDDTTEYIPSRWEKFTETKFGYWVERTFVWKYNRKIRDPYYELKWKIQRGKRGWSDCDSWSMNHWFFKNAHAMLEKWLKHGTDGHPMDVTEEEWDEILTKIRDGFKAWIDDEEMIGLMCKRCGKETCYGDDTCKCEGYSKFNGCDYDFDAWKILEEARNKQIDEALQLFAKHVRGMWD